MKNSLSLLLAICFFGVIYGQNFEVPENYQLEEVDDFFQYKGDVVLGVNWLLNTPINVEQEKRRAATAFIMKWINGSPDIHVFLSEQMCPFMKDSPGFIVYFMAGWARYAIETGQLDDKLGGSHAGLLAVVTLYENNRGIIKKDKSIEKLVKLHKNGKLKDFASKNLYSINPRE
jgi:hypothetical protein